jgi:hypothetical protein
MKKTIAVINSLLLVLFISVSADAQKDKVKEAGSKAKDNTEKAVDKTVDTSKKDAKETADATEKDADKTVETTKKTGKKAKEVVAPKSDDEIQRCVTDELAASATLKDLGLSAATSDGVVTLTGTAKSSKEKKAAGKIAKECSARTVTNNIEAPTEKVTKSEKSEKKEAKSESSVDSKEEKKSKKSDSSKKK